MKAAFLFTLFLTFAAVLALPLSPLAAGVCCALALPLALLLLIDTLLPLFTNK